MKKILASLALLLSVTGAFAQAPSPTNLGRNPYPQVGPDNRVTFRVNAPQATSLSVSLGKDYPMVKDQRQCYGYYAHLLERFSRHQHKRTYLHNF